MRTMSTPDVSSSASGFSSMGFHLSVPGMRPCAKKNRCLSRFAFPVGGGSGLTRMVMRGRDERWTTSRSDITTLTAIPISTFQMIVRKNVSDMSSRSIHARILCAAEVSAPFSFAARDSGWGHPPPVELGIVREL